MNIAEVCHRVERFIVVAMCTIACGEKDTITNRLMERVMTQVRVDHVFIDPIYSSIRNDIRTTVEEICEVYPLTDDKHALFEKMMPILGLPAVLTLADDPKTKLELMFIEIFK